MPEHRFATVFARFSFEAMHNLPNLPDSHKCKRPHGHGYKVEIAVEGPVREDFGWVIDYDLIEKIWREYLHAKLDHRNLNDVLPELKGNTTSENLCFWIRNELTRWLLLSQEMDAKEIDKLGISVAVKETDSCGARIGPSVSGLGA